MTYIASTIIRSAIVIYLAVGMALGFGKNVD
jgi:hypothetical protein